MMDPSLPDGLHQWRPGQDIRKKGNRLTIEGTDTLAGAACPFPDLIKNLQDFTGIDLPTALLTGTLHPAQLLSGEIGRTKGQLKKGFHAEMCILDWHGNVKSTWVMGKEVWRDRRWGTTGSEPAKFGHDGQVNGHLKD